MLLDDDPIWATLELIIYPFYLLVYFVNWSANHCVQIDTTSKRAESAHTTFRWAELAYTTSKWAEPALLPPNKPNQLTLPVNEPNQFIPSANEPNQLYYLRLSRTSIYKLHMSWISSTTYMLATELNDVYVSYQAQQPKSRATSAANQRHPLCSVS